MYQITNWSFVFPNPYRAPEAQRSCISGVCPERRREIRPDTSTPNKPISTSYIVEAKGRVLTTRSGSVYELVGDPDPGYLAFLKDKSIAFDPENPFSSYTLH